MHENEPIQPTQPTILVVDDNEANRALAQNTLEDEGFRVVLARNGAEGIAAFERERPDCVLLDVRMPEMDGFTACERIRALPHGPETPILFLTAQRDIDTFESAFRAGGDDFLTKPIRPTELVVRVQSAVRMRRMSDELRGHYELMKRQRDDMLRMQLQKERLMAFVVHDLKNPVSAMDLHAQFMLRERSLPASVRDSATQIRAEARQLGRMILNLLDLSKAEEGKLGTRRVDLDLEALTAEVIAELAANASSREVQLRAAIEAPRLHADEDLIRRLLTNLVENALRYAPSGTTVSVTSAPVAGGIEIRVADAGSGIPVDMREKIFDAFVQADARGAPGGRGLGLTFCKLAVEAHGGHIRVEDAGPGAVFAMTFTDEG